MNRIKEAGTIAAEAFGQSIVTGQYDDRVHSAVSDGNEAGSGAAVARTAGSRLELGAGQ